MTMASKRLKRKITPSALQRTFLETLQAEGGAVRLRFDSWRPGGVTMRWRWVFVTSQQPFRESTLRACFTRGWAREIHGVLPEEHRGKDLWTLIIEGAKPPDRAVITPEGVAALALGA